MSNLKPAKFVYAGTRAARRVLPGQKISFTHAGFVHKDVVESVFLFGPDNLLINTVAGFRVPMHWSDRVLVWEKES